MEHIPILDYYSLKVHKHRYILATIFNTNKRKCSQFENGFKKINMLKFKHFKINEIRVCVTIMAAVKWGKLCIKRVKIAV